MDCPACQTTLDAFDSDGIELDDCPGCKGLWLDAGELDALLSRKGVTVTGRDTPPGLTAVSVDPEAPKRICPRCDGSLGRFAYQKADHHSEALDIRDRGVVLDRCRTCGGIWFDRGELEKIASDSGVGGSLTHAGGGRGDRPGLFAFIAVIWAR